MILSPEDYLVLQEADVISNGKVAGLLNRNGQASWTVCPHCCVDDFTHVEGCDLTWKGFEDDDDDEDS